MPLKFKKLLSVPNKIQQVALLGNCNKSASFLKFVNSISENLVLVRGEFDTPTIPTSKNPAEEIPLNTVIVQGSFRIGLCNGYTLVPKNDPLSLLTLARQLDVDILLWGGTHNVEAYTLEGKFFINPGSCTGAFSTDWVQEGIEENYKAGDNSEEHTATEPKTETQEDNDQEAKESVNGEAVAKGSAEDEEKAQPTKQSEQPAEGDQEPPKPSNGEGHAEEDDSSDEEFDDIDINGGGIPSFCLLDIQDITCILYIYTYVDNEVKVNKVVYKKD